MQLNQLAQQFGVSEKVLMLVFTVLIAITIALIFTIYLFIIEKDNTSVKKTAGAFKHKLSIIKDQLSRQSKSIDALVNSFPNSNSWDQNLNKLREFIGLDENPLAEGEALTKAIHNYNNKYYSNRQNAEFQTLQTNTQYFIKHYPDICKPQISMVTQALDIILRYKSNLKHTGIMIKDQLDALSKDHSKEDAEEAINRLKAVSRNFLLTQKIIEGTIHEINKIA